MRHKAHYSKVATMLTGVILVPPRCDRPDGHAHNGDPPKPAPLLPGVPQGIGEGFQKEANHKTWIQRELQPGHKTWIQKRSPSRESNRAIFLTRKSQICKILKEGRLAFPPAPAQLHLLPILNTELDQIKYICFQSTTAGSLNKSGFISL